MDNVWIGQEMVAVEAHLLPDGEVQPVAFTWRGRRRQICGLGRQWDDAQGRHVLVATSDGDRFELCLTTDHRGWQLLRAWERPYRA